MPRPKNVCSKERFVRSKNWFGSTMSHGLYFAWSEPTALTLMIVNIFLLNWLMFI